MRFRALAPSCLLAALVPLAPANAQRRITLDDALAVAMHDNPDVVIGRLRADSARTEVRAARALPNPQLQTIPNVPYQYGVTLPLDVGPQRWERVRVQRLGSDAAGADLDDALRLTRFGVRQAYTDAQLAEALRRVVADEHAIVRQLLAADSARLRAGDIPVRDVARTEIELLRADAAVQRADVGVRTTRLALQLAIGIADPDSSVAVADTLRSPEGPRLTPRADTTVIARRADIRAAEARTGASRANLALARAQLVPVPQVGLVEQPGAPFASGRHEALAVGFTLPIFDRYGAARARAAASLRASEVDAQRRRIRAATEVAETADSLRVAAALAARYRDSLLSRADASLATTRYAYDAGAASLAELLDALRTRAELRAEYATALHDYWVSEYAYRRATGIEPDVP